VTQEAQTQEQLETQEGIDADAEANIRARIIHMLSVYPILSPSHIQQGMGILPGTWKPILEKLITEEVVSRSHRVAETPTGRQQTYTLLELTR